MPDQFAAARARYREAEAGQLPRTQADALRLVAGHLAGLLQSGSTEEYSGLLDPFLTAAELERIRWAAGEVARRLEAMGQPRR